MLSLSCQYSSCTSQGSRYGFSPWQTRQSSALPPIFKLSKKRAPTSLIVCTSGQAKWQHEQVQDSSSGGGFLDISISAGSINWRGAKREWHEAHRVFSTYPKTATAAGWTSISKLLWQNV